MAKKQKIVKRVDGHSQRYMTGTEKTVPLANIGTPSAHAPAVPRYADRPAYDPDAIVSNKSSFEEDEHFEKGSAARRHQREYADRRSEDEIEVGIYFTGDTGNEVVITEANGGEQVDLLEGEFWGVDLNDGGGIDNAINRVHELKLAHAQKQQEVAESLLLASAETHPEAVKWALDAMNEADGQMRLRGLKAKYAGGKYKPVNSEGQVLPRATKVH